MITKLNEFKKQQSEYLTLQRTQFNKVEDVWDLSISNGQHGRGIYAFLYGDKKMIEYYTKNGETLYTFTVPQKYVIDLSNKKYDYWKASEFIYNNPEYKVFTFEHSGYGIPTSKEVVVTDPEIIKII